MLALAPLAAVAILATVALGATFLKEGLARASAPKGKKKAAVEGELVDVDWLGEWVVKVFKEHNQFSVDVLRGGEFIIHKTGFGTPEAAMAWGRKYAEDRGA